MDAFTTLSIIKDEHRRLSAIIRSSEYLASDAQHRGGEPDSRLLAMIFEYIDAFPNRVHHPKEDQHVFAVLRRRTSAADGVLDELAAEHLQGRDRVRRLHDHLSQCNGGEPDAVRALASAVAEYAEFYRTHMRKEEEVVLPLAERVITTADWRAAQEAFQSPDTVRTDEEFRRIFQLIMRLAPPPVVRLLVSPTL
jgi:hemerythrin-like domain-containing protein